MAEVKISDKVRKSIADQVFLQKIFREELHGLTHMFIFFLEDLLPLISNKEEVLENAIFNMVTTIFEAGYKASENQKRKEKDGKQKAKA